jgi:hypothetical protein
LVPHIVFAFLACSNWDGPSRRLRRNDLRVD